MCSGSVLPKVPFLHAQINSSVDKRNILLLWQRNPPIVVLAPFSAFPYKQEGALHSFDKHSYLLHEMDTFALCQKSKPLAPCICLLGKGFLLSSLGHQIQKASQISTSKLPLKQHYFQSLKSWALIWKISFIFSSLLLDHIWGIFALRAVIKICQLFFFESGLGYLKLAFGLNHFLYR